MRLKNELKTLIPVGGKVNSKLKIGNSAPNGKITSAFRSPFIVSFLRHCGCPFAEETIQKMKEVAKTKQSINFIAVSHSSLNDTLSWANKFGGFENIQTLCDESREEYHLWGLGTSSPLHFLGPRSLLGIAFLFPKGVINRDPTGSRWQKAGTFAVNNSGIITFAHYPGYAGDLPDLKLAVSTLL
jgi:hypothetical protein